jgi:hypothetical protein
MKLKIAKSFKWPREIEYWARGVSLLCVIALAIWTITTTPIEMTGWVRAFLIIFICSALIVFYFDVRPLFRKHPSSQQRDREIPAYTEQSGRNRWIVTGLLVLAVIILLPIFVARQIQLDNQTFYTYFAGVGAWVTGIAIAVFAYQQYKLRQTEHRLLFEPQLVLTPGDISIDGLINKKEPYRIRWIVFVQNISQIPILIEDMGVRVRLAGGGSERQAILTPLYCHLTDPDSLSTPFEVNRDKPQRLVWVVEGSSAGDVFDYVSGDGGKRDFELVFRVVAIMPHDPGKPIFSKETTSWPIYVRQNANWVSKTR